MFCQSFNTFIPFTPFTMSPVETAIARFDAQLMLLAMRSITLSIAVICISKSCRLFSNRYEYLFIHFRELRTEKKNNKRYIQREVLFCVLACLHIFFSRTHADSVTEFFVFAQRSPDFSLLKAMILVLLRIFHLSRTKCALSFWKNQCLQNIERFMPNATEFLYLNKQFMLDSF